MPSGKNRMAICIPDTVWQREFEELFPFEETEDQVLAIDATKRDMESHKIIIG